MLIQIRLRSISGDDGPTTIINSENINTIHYDVRNGNAMIQMRGDAYRLHLDEDIDDLVERVGKEVGIIWLPAQPEPDGIEAELDPEDQ